MATFETDGYASSIIRSRVKGKEMRKLLLSAVDAGAEVKETKSGVLLRFNDQLTSTHGSNDGKRVVQNVRSELRRMGLNV